MEFFLENCFLIISVSAFLAGALSAIAGGGTFLTLPSLIFIGLPPVAANATSAAALLPGYLGAAFGYKEVLFSVEKKYLLKLLLVVMLSSILGAYLLVNTPNTVFLELTPWLLLVATLLFAVNPYLKNYLSHSQGNNGILHFIAITFVGGYGGYFNGGVGIAMLSALSLNKSNSIESMIAIKSILSFFLTLVSVFIFILNGLIVWWAALSMMLFSTLGGYMGSKFIQFLSPEVMRNVIITIGLLMTLIMFFSLNRIN